MRRNTRVAVTSRPEVLRPIHVRNEDDILRARECARGLAVAAGFSASDSVLLTACVSEIAREMLRQESAGTLRLLEERGCLRIEADFRARFSSGVIEPDWWFSLKRCMDEFRIEVLSDKGRRLIAMKRAWGGSPCFD